MLSNVHFFSIGQQRVTLISTYITAFGDHLWRVCSCQANFFAGGYSADRQDHPNSTNELPNREYDAPGPRCPRSFIPGDITLKIPNQIRLFPGRARAAGASRPTQAPCGCDVPSTGW